MKYPQSQFEELVRDLPVLLERYSITDKETALTHAHTLHHKLFEQKTYSDDNLNFLKEGRIIPKSEGFKLYPEGCNDSHVDTALKAAINQIFSK
jgi:hypothetical protein